MSKWQDKTDFEINKAVAWLNWKGSTVSMSDTSMPMSSCEVCKDNNVINANFDPCNNPSDAWPIILERNIAISPTSLCVFDIAIKDNVGWCADCGDEVVVIDKNPLRAAMIVYLQISGVKPWKNYY